MPAPGTNVASSSPSESVSPSSRAVIGGRSSPIPRSPASSRSDDDPGTRAADHRPMPEGDAGPDPRALLRSRAYVKLLVIAAVIGVPVSAAAYGFLYLVDVAPGTGVQRRCRRRSASTTRRSGGRRRCSRLPGSSPARRSASCRARAATRRPTGSRPAAPGRSQLPGVVLAALATLTLRRRARPGGAADRARLRARRARRAARDPRDAPPTARAPSSPRPGSFAAISVAAGLAAARRVPAARGRRPRRRDARRSCWCPGCSRPASAR